MAKSKVMELAIKIAGKVDKSLGTSTKAANKQLATIQKAANKVSTTMTAGLAAMGTGAIAATKYLADLGGEWQTATNQVAASTGAAGKELEGLRDVMEDVYAANYGDSVADVGDAVAMVNRNMANLDQNGLTAATEGALALRDAFEYDVAESTRAAEAIRKNFGSSAEEAFSLIAAGAQNGLDYSGELIDTINELPEYNALRTMRQSVRHRLNLSLKKYNLILHTTETKDPYPSANASQMSRCYDAIARIGALQYFGKAQEASALLKSALHESLQDYFIMPFIEHYNILKPLLLPLASDPVYAQFLQQARKMAITPISEKALEETTLTPREQLIISRVRDGWTNKEIADELTTIKKHLTELYKKFHVHSRTQLLLEIDKSQK